MTFVITQPCIDTMNKSCWEACPVFCIYFDEGADRMLYINPDECIDCGACRPVCPVAAIFPEDEVPEAFQDDIALNYKMEDFEDDFEVQEEEENEQPSPAEIEANKAKWGVPS